MIAAAIAASIPMGTAAAPVSEMPDESGVGTAHAPIRIRSDGDLLLPDALVQNGVRGGSGTAEDPYVISGWSIQYGRLEAGLDIANTRAHIIVRDMQLAPLEPPSYGEVAGTSILLRNVENLRMEDITVRLDWGGVQVQDSTVALDKMVFEDSALLIEEADVVLTRSRHVGPSSTTACLGCSLVASDVEHDGRLQPGPGPPENPAQFLPVALNVMSGSRPSHVTLTRFDVDGHLGGGIRQHGGSLILHDCSISNWTLSAIHVEKGQLSLEGCDLTGGSAGASGVALVESEGTLTGLRVKEPGVVGLDLRGSSATVERAVIDGTETAVRVWGGPQGPADHDVRIHNSTFVRNSYAAMDVEASQGRVDARFNYWGDEAGPRAGTTKGGRGGLIGPADHLPFKTSPEGDELSHEVRVPASGTLIATCAGLVSALWRIRHGRAPR